MRDPEVKWIWSAAVVCCAFITLASTGCNISDGPSVGETRTLSKSVTLGHEKSVDVEVNLGAGELRLAGGSTDLMNSDFTYNMEAWKPEVLYNTSGDHGTLSIRQPPGRGNYRGRRHNAWDIRLNNAVHLTMNVNLGAGKANLSLAGLNLSHFNLNVGAGEADIDLDGAWQHDLSASIHGGVGKLTLHLPADVGVVARVQGGLGAIHADGFTKNDGAYTNSAYGKSKVKLQIDIQGGMGEVDLMIGGGGTI